jgi:predicted esterase
MTLRSGVYGLLVCALVGLAWGTLPAQEKGDEKKDPPGKMEEKKGEDKKPDDKKPMSGDRETIRCQTADGVELVGDFYKPPENVGKRAPCVILLHAVGPNREAASRKDFGELPKKLQQGGFAVVTFDFRGYGESRTVDPQKYARAHRLAVGSAVSRKIDSKNFRTVQEFANLANDLVAIKIHLNKLNNEGLCNAHQVALVGIEQGALVGLMWLYNENVDESRIKDVRAARMGVAKYEGEDVLGVVWISMNGMLYKNRLDNRAIAKWMTVVRSHTATLAFYGQNDRDSKSFWDIFVKVVKPDREKDSYETTDVKRLKNTNLTGQKLLDSAAFDVEKDLLAFLKLVLKSNKPWETHKGASHDPTMVDLRVIFG